MKNLGKLLICMCISMFVISFIGLEVNAIYTRCTINYISENSNEFKELGTPMGENFKNAVLNLQEENDENFDRYEDEVSNEYIGLVYYLNSYINTLDNYGLYHILLVFGALVGVMVYFILIKQFKINKLILPFIICFAILGILYYFIMINSVGFALDELLYYFVGYTVIIFLCYIVNLCRQKKLNSEEKNS